MVPAFFYIKIIKTKGAVQNTAKVTVMTKKIINGKKYDVETARLVDRWTYGNPSDFY